MELVFAWRQIRISVLARISPAKRGATALMVVKSVGFFARPSGIELTMIKAGISAEFTIRRRRSQEPVGAWHPRIAAEPGSAAGRVAIR